MMLLCFFFNDTATTEIYTLSLHDALPISLPAPSGTGTPASARADRDRHPGRRRGRHGLAARSEEHTSELQSRPYLVCRLLPENKKTANMVNIVLITLLSSSPSHELQSRTK